MAVAVHSKTGASLATTNYHKIEFICELLSPLILNFPMVSEFHSELYIPVYCLNLELTLSFEPGGLGFQELHFV